MSYVILIRLPLELFCSSLSPYVTKVKGVIYFQQNNKVLFESTIPYMVPVYTIHRIVVNLSTYRGCATCVNTLASQWLTPINQLTLVLGRKYA